MIRLALAVFGVALVAASAAVSAEAPVRTVTMPGKLYDPASLDVLVGTTVTWRNDDSTNHTATAENDAFASGYVPPGRDVLVHLHAAGEIRVPLHDPQADARRGRRLRPRPRGAGGAGDVWPARRLRGSRPSRNDSRRPSRWRYRAHREAARGRKLRVPGGRTAPASYRAVAGALTSPRVRVLVRPIVRATRPDACSGRRAPHAPGRRSCCSRTTASCSAGAPSAAHVSIGRRVRARRSRLACGWRGPWCSGRGDGPTRRLPASCRLRRRASCSGSPPRDGVAEPPIRGMQESAGPAR